MPKIQTLLFVSAKRLALFNRRRLERYRVLVAVLKLMTFRGLGKDHKPSRKARRDGEAEKRRHEAWGDKFTFSHFCLSLPKLGDVYAEQIIPQIASATKPKH